MNNIEEVILEERVYVSLTPFQPTQAMKQAAIGDLKNTLANRLGEALLERPNGFTAPIFIEEVELSMGSGVKLLEITGTVKILYANSLPTYPDCAEELFKKIFEGIKIYFVRDTNIAYAPIEMPLKYVDLKEVDIKPTNYNIADVPLEPVWKRYKPEFLMGIYPKDVKVYINKLV